MNLPAEIFGDVVVIHAPEELNQEQSEQLLQRVVDMDRAKVVIDLDGAESISSAGLSALLDAQDRLRDASGDLKLIASNKVNRKILEITRLDRRLEIFDTVIDAVKSFQ